MAVRWRDHLPLQEGRDSSSLIITARINRPYSRRKLALLVLFLARSHLRNRWHRKAWRRQDAHGAPYKAPYAPFTRARVICACENNLSPQRPPGPAFPLAFRKIAKYLLSRATNFRDRQQINARVNSVGIRLGKCCYICPSCAIC